jgi:hypothetical protein
MRDIKINERAVITPPFFEAYRYVDDVAALGNLSGKGMRLARGIGGE